MYLIMRQLSGRIVRVTPSQKLHRHWSFHELLYEEYYANTCRSSSHGHQRSNNSGYLQLVLTVIANRLTTVQQILYLGQERLRNYVIHNYLLMKDTVSQECSCKTVETRLMLIHANSRVRVHRKLYEEMQPTCKYNALHVE